MGAQEPAADVAALELARAERLLEQGALDAAQETAAALARQAQVAPHALALLGRIAYARGDLDSAVRHLRRAIAQGDAAPRIYHALGNALQDQGKLERAIAAYRSALALRPAWPEALNDLGTACFAAGRADEAEHCYREAIRLAPSHHVAYENLGALLRRAGRLTEARRSLQRAFFWRLKKSLRDALARLAAAAPGGRRAGGATLDLIERCIREGDARLAGLLAQAAAAASAGDPAALRRLAACEQRLGRRDRAIGLLREALALRPGDADAQVELGRMLVFTGAHEEGEERLRRVLAQRPRELGARCALGHALLARGKRDEALALFRDAVRRAPRSAGAHFGLGCALFAHYRRAEAEAAFRRALELDPAHLEARTSLADALRLRGDFKAARETCEIALALEPLSEDARLGMALTHFAFGEGERAIAMLRAMAEANPGAPRPLRHLGGLLRDSGSAEQAIPYLERALRLDPKDPDAMRFLGSALSDLGRYAEARGMFEAALAAAPQRADLWNELGVFEMFAGTIAAAERCFRRAIELAPEQPAQQNNLGHCLIARGELEEGWARLDYRGGLVGHAEGHQRFALPRWEGGPLGGKAILVYAEQGLGDEILFSSCVPDLARAARRVLLECDRRLGGIFARSFPGVEVHAADRWRADEWYKLLEPKPDLQVAAGSLPRFLRRRIEDFPRHAGYLKADPARIEHWRERLARLGPGLRIGISWKGGFIRTGEMRRTLPLERLLPILRQPGAAFVNLQYTDARADLRRLEERHGVRIRHWPEAIEDYENTAALVCALDGVISVCTSLVHLCGALGRPVWVLAPYNPGFRYRIGERNPWYPSVELFEQEVPGQWEPVIARVAERLSAAIKAASFTAINGCLG